MKRSYFRRRSALFSSPARVAVAAALLVAVVALALRLFAPSAFFAAAKPAFALGEAGSAETRGFFASFSDAAALASRVAELEGQVRALSNENLALSAALADIGATDGDEAGDLYAGVIARPPLAPYDMLIVGKGADDGVRPGDLVTAEGGVPLGAVSSVARRTAQVSLYSAPGRHSEGWAGEGRLPVTLVGKGGGAFGAEVPRDAALVEGDVVYLPGPGALPVGRIAAIETDPASPSAKLRIEPLVNAFSLAVVRVKAAP
jgi:rod shape-determining protein MreC